MVAEVVIVEAEVAAVVVVVAAAVLVIDAQNQAISYAIVPKLIRVVDMLAVQTTNKKTITIPIKSYA